MAEKQDQNMQVLSEQRGSSHSERLSDAKWGGVEWSHPEAQALVPSHYVIKSKWVEGEVTFFGHQLLESPG